MPVTRSMRSGPTKSGPGRTTTKAPDQVSPKSKASPNKRVTPTQRTSPLKRASPVKRVSPTRKASPIKEASPAKKVSPIEKASPIRKASPIKKSPIKKSSPVKRVSPMKKTSPKKPASPEKRSSPSKAKPAINSRTGTIPKSTVTSNNPANRKPTVSLRGAQPVVSARRVRDIKPVKANLDLKEIQLLRVINESINSKSITFLADYEGQSAVVKLDKTNFDEELVKKALVGDGFEANQLFCNDVYSSYLVCPPSSTPELSSIQATVVWPANEAVLTKYSHADHILYCESPDAYLKVVEPFIADLLATDKEYNNWVYNILEGRSETDRVLINDPNKDSGFMLVHDLKWSGDEKDLKLIAICHRRDIRSLRDLTDKHLVLLKNILTKGTKAIKDKYKKLPGPLRTYIHYQPSFYHFHVHFKLIDASDYISNDRDNLLSTVISNLTLNKDYYKKSTLTYPLSVKSSLYQELVKAKRV